MGFFRSIGKAVKSCFKAVGNVVASVAKGVGNFIAKHGKKLLAGAAIIAGIALCFCPGGIAIGAGLICGGINAGMLSFSKNASWKDFGKAFLGGFAAGCITTLAAPYIAAMATAAGGIATSTFAATAISCTVSAAAYAGIGVFTNGINNKVINLLLQQQKAICGGLIGFISPVINSAGINETVVKFFKPLEDKFGIALTTGMMASVGGRGLRMAANFCISAITQKIQTGRISLQRAMVDSVVYGYVNHRMAAQAIETGIPQLCTVDQAVPYTFVSQQVNVVAAAAPSTSVSQPLIDPSNPPPRIEPVNSNRTAPMPISTRAPPITEPAIRIEERTFRNVQNNVRSPTAATTPRINETQTQPSRDTVIETSENIQRTTASPPSVALPSTSLPANQENISLESTTSNQILQALNRLRPVNHDLIASQATCTPEIQPMINPNAIVSERSELQASATSVAARNDTVLISTPDTVDLQPIVNDVKIGVAEEASNILTSVQPGSASSQIQTSATGPLQVESQKTSTQTIQKQPSTNQTFTVSQHTVTQQSSLFVSNIVEELKFIENERNRTDENVTNGPSRVYIFQNAMDNENVKVGVQVAAAAAAPNSNAPHNPGIQTINIEKDENGMGYGQKLSNQNSAALQQPTTSTSNSVASNSQQNLHTPFNSQNVETPKIVVTFPIISFIENEYKILHWEEWPQLSKDIKIITVSGPHASGRTTFIHSLIYFWGYKLLKDQIIISKLRIGVILYHIPDKNLVILDCCDSMDASNPDEITASSLILETFCHLISDHRIHHIAIDEKSFSSPQQYFEHYEKRMKILYGCGIKAVPNGGGLQSTLLMRYHYLSNEQMKGFDEWHENWEAIKMSVKEEITYLGAADENSLTENQKKEAMNLCENGFFNHDVTLLKFLPEDYSINDLAINQQQLQFLTTLIEEKTKPFNVEENSKNEDIRKLLCQAWYFIVTNENLKTDFTNIVNQVATSVEGNDYDIQGFVNKLIKYVENYKNEIFVKKFGKFVEEIGKRLEASKDKADPLIAFELVSGSSSIFFEEGLRNDDLKIQNDMIDLALEGFTFFLRGIENSQNFELLSIRMAINDQKILEKYLNSSIVYQNFDRCWHFLQYAAIYGYRLELIEYDIFAKILQIINKQSFSTEGERIATWALSTLQALLTLDTSKVFGEDPPPSDPDKLQLSQQQFAKTLGIFDKLVEKKMEPLRTTRNMSIEEVQKNYDEVLKYPEEFFNSTDISKKNGKTFDDLDPRQAHFFTTLLFRQLYKSLAFYFADKVIENHQTFMSRENDPVEIVTAKIKVWQRVLSLCEESEALYKSILEKTDIKKWVLEMLKHPNSPYFINALELSNSILTGDYHSGIRMKLAEEISSKEVKRNRVNTLEDIRRQELRKELLKHYGDFCLDLIEAGHVERIIDIFLDRHFEAPSKATVFVSHIERLLHYGKYEEDRLLCLDIFIKKRLKIISKLGGLFKGLLNADEVEIRKSKHFMTASALLISELIYYFFANDQQKFYQSNKESEKMIYESEAWDTVMLIIGITVRDILERRKNTKQLDDEDDDNIFRPRIVLSFIYNIAMTSEITNCDIIANTTRQAGLEDTDEGNWDRMILSEQKFIQIKKDDVNIRRCAYIYAKYVLPKIIDSKKSVNLNLKESFAAELTYFKQMFKKHVGEVAAEVEEKEKIEGWIHAEEARQKHLGRLEERITGPSELNFGNVTPATNVPSTSVQYSNEFAIEDVLVYCKGHPFLDGIKVSSANRKIEIYEKLKEKYGNGIAISLMICIDRSSNKNESIKKFLNLIKKIAKNVGNDHLELKVQNINIQTILQLPYAWDALEAFGYRKVMRDNEEWLIANDQKCEIAKICLKFIDTIDENTVFEWHFDSSFQYVKNGNIPLLECRLPPIFFNKNNDSNASISLPIRILKEKRRFYSFSNFSLIRIKLQDGSFFQAVFHKSATLNDIGAELDLFFLNELKADPVYCICDENGQEIDDISKSLDKFSFYPAIIFYLN